MLVIPYKVYPSLTIGPFSLQPWGIMVFLAFVSAIVLVLMRVKQKNIKAEVVLDLALIIVISAIIGSRLFVVFEYLPYFFKNPLEIVKVWQGGMAFWGGFLMSATAVFLYIRIRKLQFWKLADIIAPALALAMAIGRIGNFLQGQHLGKITNLPWGIEYMGVLRHPIAIYELVNDLILFFVLLILTRKVKKEGVLFIIFLFWYSIVRFGLDFLRNDDLATADPHYLLHLTAAQYICLPFIFGSLFMFYKIYRRSTNAGESEHGKHNSTV